MECKTCGNDHPESYCPACGEKAFNPKQLSLKHFVEETFEGFIHFDSKFFRTVKTLITKPGQLSLNYTQGRRVLYMKPIQFFLVVNLLFFIFAITNMYSLPLYNYTTYTPFTKFNTVHIVNDLLIKTKLSRPVYEQIFDEKIKGLSKELIFLFVPLYGCVFALLFYRKKQFFVEHLVFATHFCAFILLLTLAGFYLLTLPYALIYGAGYSANYDDISSLLIEIIIAVYAGVAIRRFYQTGIIWTVITSLIIGLTFFPFIQIYRMILFFKIIYF